MKEKRKQQLGIIMARKIKNTKLKIDIISICPVCGHIWGIVSNDKEPIRYRPGYVELTDLDTGIIPEVICDRQECQDQICEFSDQCRYRPADICTKEDAKGCAFASQFTFVIQKQNIA